MYTRARWLTLTLCFAACGVGCAGASTPTPANEPAPPETSKDAGSSKPTPSGDGAMPAPQTDGGGPGSSADVPSVDPDPGGADPVVDALPSDAQITEDSRAPVGDAGASGDAAAVEGPAIPGCKLLWSPSAMRDGEKAFELAEMPDVMLPGGSGPTHGGVKHITAVADHDAYRIDSHYSPPAAADFDRVTLTGPTRTDRLRCETRGMVGPSGQIDLLNGQTWRLQWLLYLPSTLKGTSRFTHIMQMKYVDTKGGVSGSPIVTLTLRPGDKMEILFWLGGGSIATVDASALHDKWISADLTMKLAPAGSVHWVLKEGDRVVVEKTQNGVTWPGDGARLRPKWGIYRGVTTGVETTYIMLSQLRAYQCQ